VHTKNVFNIYELEKKARQRLLYRYRGKNPQPTPLTPEQIAHWYTRTTPWKEENIPGKGVVYSPSKTPYTVYEFREGKLRPLKSNPYYYEIRQRAAERGKKNVMVLEGIIQEKERLVAELEKKKPKSAKKTTRRYALISHNRKLEELYATIVAASQMQLIRMDQLTKYIENTPLAENERMKQLEAIRDMTKAIEARKAIAEKEKFHAGNRINLLNEFPGIAGKDRKEMQRLAAELNEKGKMRDAVEKKWLEARGRIGASDEGMEFARAQAQLQYWLAFNTLCAAYMKAYHTYGTTLSRVEVEDIENMIPESRERIHYFRQYAQNFRPKAG
jgi:hypothetical protein